MVPWWLIPTAFVVGVTCALIGGYADVVIAWIRKRAGLGPQSPG